MASCHLLLNGEIVAGSAGAMGVINPASEKVFSEATVADADQLDAAVDAAQRAFASWRKRSWSERRALLVRLADALEQRTELLAELLTREQGKPLRHARNEILGSAKRIRDLASLQLTDRSLVDSPDLTISEHVMPLGVVGIITPWNFPVALLVNKLAPALLAGNTVVVKPAPTTPLTTGIIGELCAGIFPRGVVNVIIDRNDLGQRLTEHPGVAKISFTGSTATGKKVMAAAAGTLKRVTLELGGNDAAIVLDDVHVEEAARKVFAGAMVNSGQVCVAIKRVYVPTLLYRAFCKELTTLAARAVVGDGMDPATELGPVQNRAQFEKVVALADHARKYGRVLFGGSPLQRSGYFMPPTVVCDLDDSSPLVADEQFGPLLPVLPYEDPADALRRANSSPYGLAATIWSRDPARGADLATGVEAGTVWVNHHMAMRYDIPFRGLKQSGLGTELALEGLEEFVQRRVVSAVH
jgi:acyl-CoA reductase-like NAD-dependent aldehyde dehydrogenase